MTIFADASAMVALFDEQDLLHLKAVDLSTSLGINNVITSNYVFAEIVTIVSQHAGKAAGIEAGLFLKKHYIIFRLSEEEENLAWDIFKSHTSKNVSYVDCTIFALYKKGLFDKCFSFDDKFKNQVPLLK